jgi:hypothetical protein
MLESALDAPPDAFTGDPVVVSADDPPDGFAPIG